MAYIKLFGFSHKIKAGIYEIKPEETLQSFIDKVVAGDVLKLSFTIVEGTTVKTIRFGLQSAPYLHYQPEDWFVFAKKYPNKEGLLLADTYQYNAGSDASNLLTHANQSLWAELNKAWQGRDKSLPYQTPYELLVVASILEKETRSFDEKKLISGVIVNRLNKNMRLQVDPTVIYGLGDSYTGKLDKKGLSVDSPYNTYKNKGLPPTPIAMVGREAILAAAHPKKSDYLYFVAKGNGGHHFSKTYAEQRQAIKRYLKKQQD